MYSEKDTYGARPSGLNPRNPQQKAIPQQQQQEPPRPSDREVFKALLEQTAKELELKSGEPLQHVQLDQETIRTLVAPIVANVEPDNYPCFDRTDLEYQHAIAKDPSSSLLLANYAQFLYVVRHDNNRAEEFFHRAMRVDPLDAAVLGRFASFLWLGRGNKVAAERAYKAAMASDPENPFHAGSYAHFLWHAGEGYDETSCPVGPTTV
jgi:tetratricopeptide (TPR) repeat protein